MDAPANLMWGWSLERGFHTSLFCAGLHVADDLDLDADYGELS